MSDRPTFATSVVTPTNAYTRAGLAQTYPTASTAILQLQGMGLGRSATGLSAATIPNASSSSSSASVLASNTSTSLGISQSVPNIRTAPTQSPRAVVEELLSFKGSNGDGARRADGVVHNLGLESTTHPYGQEDSGKLASRYSALVDQEKQTLKELLHFGTLEEIATTSGDRTLIRSTLISAFAQNASFGGLRAIRDQLLAHPQRRNDIFLTISNRDMPVSDFVANLGRVKDITVGDIGAGPGLMKMINPQLGQQVDTYYAGIREKSDAAFDASLKSRDDTRATNLLGIPMPILKSLSSEDIKCYREGFAAIGMYCTSLFKEMNAELRVPNSNPAPHAVKQTVRLATAAMKLLPDYKGLVVSGYTGGAWSDQYKPGVTITHNAFTSASANQGFLKSDTIFITESQHGKVVSGLSTQAGTAVFGSKSDGDEVLFPPGTKFQVIDRVEGTKPWKPGDNQTVVILRELG